MCYCRETFKDVSIRLSAICTIGSADWIITSVVFAGSTGSGVVRGKTISTCLIALFVEQSIYTYFDVLCLEKSVLTGYLFDKVRLVS